MALRDTHITKARFAFVDTETTGMSPLRGDKLCEVAVVVSQGGDTVEEFSSIINPLKIIPQEVINIHGITNEMARTSPTFAQIAPRLAVALTDSVLVCHNADFDVPFLAAEFATCGLSLPRTVVLDTLKFARKNGTFKKNRLGAIVEELGFSNEGWHRALADAKMTEKVFYHFLEKFIKAGAQTVGDLEEFQIRKICAQ
ncbi:DNA polymerase III epsilon subunit family exonuclease [Elusimicrobium posterum]|uniref:3'-5' exonuclease n=1 Tax=Elusimicrobium posterum TaxID=3116653 RepID=UPI003C74B760